MRVCYKLDNSKSNILNKNKKHKFKEYNYVNYCSKPRNNHTDFPR